MRYFLSIFFMLLFAFNSISLILPYTELYADIEFSINPENKTEQEPKEERTDPESKEKFQPYSIVMNNIILDTNGRKNNTAFSNSSFIEEVNIKNPTPPPERA
jgi:anionic cell wall polymer biosynthesis LytR-Cps2A-Psr (LCP) family protein